MPFQKIYFDLAEVQAATGISWSTWREWALSGKVSFTRVGPKNKILIPVSEVERAIYPLRLAPESKVEHP